MVKVAILGYGTVGCGVAEVLESNKCEIQKSTNKNVEVKYILDIRQFPGDKNEDKIVNDINIILDDPEIAVCCETMGGKHPAYEFTKAALEKGKSVCSSNKELVEAFGPELLQLAKENNCSYMFEASVGGGIPIIRNINYCLQGEKIQSITGILNGTTNYMLTKMEMEGAEYAEVLKEAQEKGYAEKDPTADVEGHDAGRKIAILSSLACGKTVSYDKLYVEGISKISSIDFLYAKELGYSIKLFGKSVQSENGICAMVAPFLVNQTNTLYAVKDVYNGILVTGNMLGNFMLYGAGAGKLPTASAVVADVIEASQNIGKNISCVWDKEEAKLTSFGEMEHRFFVRINEKAKIDASKSFDLKDFYKVDGLQGECAFITEMITEEHFSEMRKNIKNDILSVIRIS